MAAVAAFLIAVASGDREKAFAPVQYVGDKTEFSWVVVRAPLPAEQVGRAAVRAVDGESALPPEGLEPEGAVPPGFPALGFEAADKGRAPFAAASGSSRRDRCKCNTEIGNTRVERVAALYATTTFDVGDELEKLGVLVLETRFSDGLVAYINGREIARRNIPRGSGTMTPANRIRGPEAELFRIPVVTGLLRRGENRLSILVKPSGHSLAPRLSASLRGEAGGKIIRGPVVQRVGPTSATLVFDTDLPTTGAIEIGSGSDRRRVASAGGSLAVHHVVELDGLPAASKVDYRAVAGGAGTEPLAFHTAPDDGEPIRFVVYGDMRGGHRTHAKIVASVLKEAPDFVVVTGDLVLRGSDEADWQRFFEVTRDLLARIPYYPVAGNHDTGKTGDEERRMNEIFELWPGPAGRPSWGHWYSYDVAGVHFVMLDSNSYKHEEQLAWLKSDLKAARAAGAQAIFAAVHDGPYSRGIHRGNRYAAEHYAPVLADSGVTMLFSGHDHLYQRGKVARLDYIVSGGGGAPLYPVRCGVAGKKKCPVDDGMQHVVSEFHYVLVTVYDKSVNVCPKRPDRTALEKCIRYRLLPKRTK